MNHNLSVHFREHEVQYDFKTKKPRSVHDHPRDTDPDPDRIRICGESARGPSAGTKRPWHRRVHHYLWCPGRNSHPSICRFRFHPQTEPISEYRRHTVQLRSGLLSGHDRSDPFGMADAIAVLPDTVIHLTGNPGSMSFFLENYIPDTRSRDRSLAG